MRGIRQVLFGVAFSIAAVASADPGNEVSLLVQQDWLNAHLKDDDIRLVDIRTAAEFAAGHIPGAVNVESAELFDRGKREGYVATLKEVSKVFNAAGIDNKRRIVLYDEGSFFNAGRAFWIFELYGLDHVAVLDGGIAAWVRHDGELSKESVTVAASNYQPHIRSNRLATKFVTNLAIENPNIEIVDARSNDEYEGRITKAARAGHIPTAINVPSDESFVEIDGVRRMRPETEIAAMYSKLDRSKKVITYCNRGRHAAVAYFNLRRIGYDTAVFDGSWQEWGNDSALPIEMSN